MEQLFSEHNQKKGGYMKLGNRGEAVSLVIWLTLIFAAIGHSQYVQGKWGKDGTDRV